MIAPEDSDQPEEALDSEEVPQVQFLTESKPRDAMTQAMLMRL